MKFKGSYGSHRAAPEPMCLPTMTQAGREHATQCTRLVHADALRIAPCRVTIKTYVEIYFPGLWKNTFYGISYS